MFLRKVRRIGRVFAVALLVWTAVDLLDRRACQNHPELLMPAAAAAASVASPADTHEHRHDGPPPGHAGDCFCCSAFVDVQMPFALELTYSVLWLEPTATHDYISVTPAHIYRPPIA